MIAAKFPAPTFSMSPLDSLKSKQPPQSRLLNTQYTSYFGIVHNIFIKIEEKHLFYSIAAMSYPCLTKLTCVSPNLLFPYFDWNPWMVNCALVSQSFKKFEWSMTGQPVSNSPPLLEHKYSMSLSLFLRSKVTSKAVGSPRGHLR